MTWSCVPTTYQERMVFQAGGPDGWSLAVAASGRWVAHSTRAVSAGTPLAKPVTKTDSFR